MTKNPKSGEEPDNFIENLDCQHERKIPLIFLTIKSRLRLYGKKRGFKKRMDGGSVEMLIKINHNAL
jgi:hypothetical protein